MLIEVKKAETEQDFFLLADLARDIWLEHYVSIIGLEQTEYMLSTMQSMDAIAKQVLDGTHYNIGLVDREPAAYSAFSVCRDTRQVFLSKMYVSAPYRRNGVAGQLLKIIETEALKQGCRSIRLTVNRNNTDAINAYTKLGFHTKGGIVTDIGHGFVMDDFEMGKMLSPFSILAQGQLQQEAPSSQRQPSMHNSA